MIVFNNLLAVGATNRNLGKTEFICQLITRFQGKSIIALKIKTFYPGDTMSHGKGSGFKGEYLIRKETEEGGVDDSKRFLASGASAVYYIKSKIQDLKKAIEEVRCLYPDSQLFIAESNSLLKYYKPGAFVMIKGPDQINYKPSSIQFMDRADLMIESDGTSFSKDPQSIDILIDRASWTIQ